MIDDTT